MTVRQKMAEPWSNMIHCVQTINAASGYIKTSVQLLVRWSIFQKGIASFNGTLAENKHFYALL
jgi:hypothetical protein